MRVLITGATGYLGQDLVRKLNANGYIVTCLVRHRESLKKLKAENLHSFIGDLTRPETLSNVTRDMDYVIHLAVLGHYEEAVSRLDTFRSVNVQGTENLLKEIVKNPVRKIICVSSTAAIGPVKSNVIDEKTQCSPKTDYGISKYEADVLINKYFMEFDIPVVTLRFSHIYGPGDHRDFLKIVKLAKRGIFPIIGFRKNTYPAIFKEDALNSILLAIKNGENGELYNITDKESHNLRFMVKRIQSELGIKRIPLWLPKCPTLIFLKSLEWFGIPFPVTSKNIEFVTSGRRFSIDKATNTLGFRPLTSLEEGIRQTLAYYIENGYLDA